MTKFTNGEASRINQADIDDMWISEKDIETLEK